MRATLSSFCCCNERQGYPRSNLSPFTRDENVTSVAVLTLQGPLILTARLDASSVARIVV